MRARHSPFHTSSLNIESLIIEELKRQAAAIAMTRSTCCPTMPITIYHFLPSTKQPFPIHHHSTLSKALSPHRTVHISNKQKILPARFAQCDINSKPENPILPSDNLGFISQKVVLKKFKLHLDMNAPRTNLNLWHACCRTVA